MRTAETISITPRISSRVAAGTNPTSSPRHDHRSYPHRRYRLCQILPLVEGPEPTMPQHAYRHRGEADEQAGGPRRPDVRPEGEKERRDDQFATGDAEQTADQ